MKLAKLLLVLFIILGVIFVIGSLTEHRTLHVIGNFFLVPVLLLYYRFKTSWVFLPVAASLLLLYIRDIFYLYGFQEYNLIIGTSFFLALGLLLLCVVTSFKKPKVHPLEILSFLIMYGFLFYLLYSLYDAIEGNIVSERLGVFVYLLILMLFVAFSFTSYIIKPHLASLLLLVGAASFMVSEVSLFFKLFVVEDISVNFFYPFFHVVAYFAFVEYGIRRWRTGKLRYF